MKFSCAGCQTGLKKAKIGVILVETAGEEQRPYLIFNADILECPICHTRTVYTDARATHASTMSESEILSAVVMANEAGNLVMSHEFPAGSDFVNKYLFRNGE